MGLKYRGKLGINLGKPATGFQTEIYATLAQARELILSKTTNRKFKTLTIIQEAINYRAIDKAYIRQELVLCIPPGLIKTQT